jgi:hypothetical protein
VPGGELLARRREVSIATLEDEALILPRRHSQRPFRSLVEYLCAHPGFGPRVVFEVDAPPAAQALVAAVPVHGLTLVAVASAATVRLAEGPVSQPTECRSTTRNARARQWAGPSSAPGARAYA